jgi:hypothetical protein
MSSSFQVGDRIALTTDLTRYHPGLVTGAKGVVLDLVAHGTTNCEWIDDPKFGFCHFDHAGYHDILWTSVEPVKPDLSTVRLSELLAEVVSRPNRRFLEHYPSNRLAAELTDRGYTVHINANTQARLVCTALAQVNPSSSLNVEARRRAKKLSHYNRDDAYGWTVYVCKDGSRFAVWFYSDPKYHEGVACEPGEVPIALRGQPPI